MMEFKTFLDSHQTMVALCETISSGIIQILDKQPECSLAIAGGNTPKPLYQMLSNQDLPWGKVNVTLTDERWLEPSDPNSNQNMVWHNLLKNYAEEVSFIPLKNPYATPMLGHDECEAMLLESIPNLDMVILGMGEDGHFASIFPNMENTAALLATDNPKKCMATQPENKEARMSLTLSYLLKSKNIYLLVSGENKKSILDKVLKDNEIKNAFPVSALLLQDVTPVHIYWNP